RDGSVGLPKERIIVGRRLTIPPPPLLRDAAGTGTALLVAVSLRADGALTLRAAPARDHGSGWRSRAERRAHRAGAPPRCRRRAARHDRGRRRRARRARLRSRRWRAALGLGSL